MKPKKKRLRPRPETAAPLSRSRPFLHRHLILFLLIGLPLIAQADLRILNGRFSPESKAGFKQVPAKYAPGRVQYLEERTLEAFLKLTAAAKKAGFDITIVSATRNFVTQKAIWEQKFSGSRKVSGKNLATALPDPVERSLEILKYSSMPGTSRHHWGTDFDLHEARLKGTPLTNEAFGEGRGQQFYQWLTANAPAFGFCQPYSGSPDTRNGGRFAHGYLEERWHWSYKPVAAQYLKAYLQNSGALAPAGFQGEKAAGGLFLDYVQNIDPGCL